MSPRLTLATLVIAGAWACSRPDDEAINPPAVTAALEQYEADQNYAALNRFWGKRLCPSGEFNQDVRLFSRNGREFIAYETLPTPSYTETLVVLPLPFQPLTKKELMVAAKNLCGRYNAYLSSLRPAQP